MICDCERSHNGLGLAGRECDCEDRRLDEALSFSLEDRDNADWSVIEDAAEKWLDHLTGEDRGTEMSATLQIPLIQSELDERLMRKTLLKCYGSNPKGFRVSSEHYRYLAEQIVALRDTLNGRG